MKSTTRTFLIMILILCVLVSGCGEDEQIPPAQTVPDETTEPVVERGELVILFTGGLNNVYAADASQGLIGYAALVEYRTMLEENGQQVILIDGGGSVAYQEAGTFENSDSLWDIVVAAVYDVRVPGVLELSGGVEELQKRAEQLSDCTYISCNLLDSASGSTIFDPYVIVEAGELKIGFVGITFPDAASYVLPDHGLCQENGGQALYDAVQQAIDDATDAGAEYVIAVGNLGTDPGDSPWTAPEVIANTTGLAAFLDSGGSVIEGNVVVDKDDFSIPVCAVGTEFHYVGQVTLNLNDGSASVTLIDALGEEDETLKSMADDLTADMDAVPEPTEDTTEATEEIISE